MIPLARIGTYAIYRFGTRISDRIRVIDALADSDDDQLNRLAIRLDACCDAPGILIDETEGTVRIQEMRCRSRLCPLCREAICRRYMTRCIEAMVLMDGPKLLTLTIRSDDRPLHAQIHRLKEAFRRLRRQRPWKNHVKGGVATFEITFNRRTNQWHPHLHAIIDSLYFRQAKLLAGWELAVGDSAGVDIRPVRSRAGAARYVAKYVSKSNNPAEFPDDRLQEWAREVRSLRFFITFGSVHNLKSQDPDEDENPDQGKPQYVGSPTQLILAAGAGDQEAQALLALTEALAKRRISDADPEAFAEHKAAVGDLAGRLRTWFCNHKIYTDREVPDAARPPPRRGGSNNRQLWFGKEFLAPAGY